MHAGVSDDSGWREAASGARIEASDEKCEMKKAMGVVILLALSAQITPAFAESAIEAAYALFANDGDYEPTPPSGVYFKKEPMECKNGKNDCFLETTFKRMDDCRYIKHNYFEPDLEHPGRGLGADVIYDFGKARRLEFRKAPIAGGAGSVPGVAIDGKNGLVCFRSYLGRTPDRSAIDGAEECEDKLEVYYLEKWTASNARPKQTLFGKNADHILKLPNRAQFRSHWAVLREYCPDPTGD